MEIKYPIIIVISILIFIGIFFVKKLTKANKNNKNKVANTSIVKNTEEYKKVLRQYRFILYLLYVLIFICVLTTSILSSRIVEEKVTSDDIYNRDIILCMDVSSSGWEPDLDLINSYKEIVKSLKGERFGISIFNTTSYLLVPLTDDYNYLIDTLDTLYKSIDYNLNYYGMGDGGTYSDLDITDRLRLLKYIQDGTVIDAQSRGSSFSGDGLASCVFDFPDLETDKERSRIIVLSTDDDVYGPGNDPDRSKAKQYIEVTEAAKLSKKNNIVVYTIAPNDISSKNSNTLKTATQITGGEYYIYGKGPTVENIVKQIESREKTKLEGNERTAIVDYPTIPFVILLIAFLALVIIEKVVLS